ncbi:MAG: FAD-binding oxidoreductase, partial [Rhizobiales bacterium]|nr:FAD-binding oxidoreductase [Hyphomicrobiales bacterium]
MSSFDTFYTETAINTAKFESLNRHIDTDVCVIGAGMAGLSCAQSLRDLGKNVVLLEAKEVAWGASGRNGGFVFPGYANGQDYIERKLGLKAAQSLFSISLEGVKIISDNIERYNLNGVTKTHGILSVIRYDNAPMIRDHCVNMQQKYDYELEFVDPSAMSNYAQTDSYFQG